MKKFLAYTGVGDISQEYRSWFKDSSVYDIAANYFGNKTKTYNDLRKVSSNITQNSGMIFTNFARDYDNFKDYEYVLIVDSDIILNKNDIEDTFNLCYENNWSAASFSRDHNSYGHFVDVYKQDKNLDVVDTSYIEQNLTFIRKDLLRLLVEKWFEFELEYSTGIDILLTNVAYHNNMLPFKILHNYSFYNPWPHDKNNIREIDNVANSDTRMEKLIHLINTSGYFKYYESNEYNNKIWTRGEEVRKFFERHPG